MPKSVPVSVLIVCAGVLIGGLSKGMRAQGNNQPPSPQQVTFAQETSDLFR